MKTLDYAIDGVVVGKVEFALDRGAQRILASGAFQNLKYLTIEETYVTAPVVDALRERLGGHVVAGSMREERHGRYVSVAE